MCRRRFSISLGLILSLASLPIAQQLLGTVLFLSIFVHLYSGLLSAASLLFGSLGVCLSAWSFVVLRDRIESTASLSHQPSHLPQRRRGRGRRGRRRHHAPNPVLGLLVLSFILLALSPVLKTLTEATTSDSIWALAAGLFAVHLVLANYSIPSAPSSPPSSSSSSSCDSSSSLRSNQLGTLGATLSLNAAVCGSVVLASRLSDDLDVFALILLSSVLFGLGPLWKSRILTPLPSHGPNGRWKTNCTLTAALLGATWKSLVSIESYVLLAITVAAVAFVTILAPAWMRWAQRWKMQIQGPWDPAVPMLSTKEMRGVA
ncbi:glycosylphosphatidylinositol anchor biosynthesis [Thecaphora frezii]